MQIKISYFLNLIFKKVVEIKHVEINEGKTFLGFVEITPKRFVSLSEIYINYLYIKVIDKEFIEKSKSLGTEQASLVLESPQFQVKLPIIQRIFTVPIPIICNGKLLIPKYRI